MKPAAFCLVTAMALASLTSAAQAPSHPFLEELTWTELRAEVQGGKTTVLIPIGGTEQNGPHIALGKHNVRVKALAGRIAAQLGNALVAPVIAYVPEGTIDPPSEHMRFPGTITVPRDAFEKVVESAAQSLRRHGFRDIVLIGDHGGYQASLRRVAERLNREWQPKGTRVHAIREYYDAVEKDYPELLRLRGFTAAEIGLHAGLADTALTLALDPSLVRRDRLAGKAGTGEGVRGDPSRATAEIGQAGVDLVVARTAEAIRKSIAR